MSHPGSQSATATAASGLPSSSQPLAPPPRTSSREPSLSRNIETGAGVETSRGQYDGATEPTSGVLGQTTDQTGRTEQGAMISGNGSKRSLAGSRRRDRSAASTGSYQQRNVVGEKDMEAGSGDRAAQTGQPAAKKKKKGGFLSFLNCCSAGGENQEAGQSESAQPAKAPVRTQPTRVQQPHSSRPVADVDTRAAESEKPREEVVDERPVQPPHQDVVAAAAALPAAESERPAIGDSTVDNTTSSLPATAPANPVVQPLKEDISPMVARDPAPGQLHSEAPMTAPTELPANPSPEVPTQRPVTPIMSQSMPEQEDEIILDRTPEQVARDNDIEMSDSGPSLPLTEQDAAIVVQEEILAHQQRQGDDLPPPPPLQSRQDQVAGDGSAVSHDTSLVSTPEPQRWLLPPLRPEMRGRKCLVLDLDETLVHSSFKVFHQADFSIPVEIEGQYHNVYVIKRPGVDAFMKRVGELYEIVIFTASVSKYGDPVLDKLDIHHVVHHRLFRESCYNHQGNYVKDLSQIGRDLRETIIIDNSPTSYIFHPQHAVPVSSWFSDAHDNELLDLIPVLEDLAGPQVSDVSLVLDVAL